MSAKGKTALQKMDALVRWSNASDMVRRDMSDDADTRRRYRPMRWLPLLPMACGAGLISWAIASPIAHALYVIAAPIVGTMAAVSINGPLGKPSMEDDEREAALRKDAFLFCLAVLAFANIVGGPILMLTAALHGWPVERIVGVAFALVIGNLAWFGSLPTLYASWKAPKLSVSDEFQDV